MFLSRGPIDGPFTHLLRYKSKRKLLFAPEPPLASSDERTGEATPLAQPAGGSERLSRELFHAVTDLAILISASSYLASMFVIPAEKRRILIVDPRSAIVPVRIASTPRTFPTSARPALSKCAVEVSCCSLMILSSCQPPLRVLRAISGGIADFSLISAKLCAGGKDINAPD